MGRAAAKAHTLCGERTDAAETHRAMRAQSQMGCREMERDEKSVRLKFSGCSEIKSDERSREKGSRWRGLVV